jgi:hypothetical protein
MAKPLPAVPPGQIGVYVLLPVTSVLFLLSIRKPATAQNRASEAAARGSTPDVIGFPQSSAGDRDVSIYEPGRTVEYLMARFGEGRREAGVACPGMSTKCPD